MVNNVIHAVPDTFTVQERGIYEIVAIVSAASDQASSLEIGILINGLFSINDRLSGTTVGQQVSAKGLSNLAAGTVIQLTINSGQAIKADYGRMTIFKHT